MGKKLPPSEMKTSRKERRQKFDKWIDKDFLRSQWLDGKVKSMPFYGNPSGEVRLPKTMTNADRRRLGIDQDEALEDYVPDYKPEANDEKGNKEPGHVVESDSKIIIEPQM